MPPGFRHRVEIRGEPREMCCRGCEAVARAIVDGGLEGFYDHRTAPAPTAAELVPEALRRMELYDQHRLQESFVERDEGSVRHASLILEGITCAACVWLNEHHVGRLPGVLEFSVNYSTHRARVRWDDSRIHLSEILKAIASIGYIAHPFDPGRQEDVYRRERAQALRRLAVAGLGAMQVMMIAVALYAGEYSGMEPEMRGFLRWVSLLIALPVVLYSAQTFFRSAWRDLRGARLGMDVPVALAIGAAFLASLWGTVTGGGEVYFDSACMFTFFLLASRFLEMGARHRAGQAAEELVRLLPATATRLTADGEEDVAVAELVPGDRVRVRPGETVPADGAVLEGASSVDESLLTGESLPRARESGDALVGGTLNVESPLVMRVEKVGEDTLVSAIIRLLDRAQTEKPRVARLADRVAGWFVGALLLLAAGVASYWWLHSPDRAFSITLAVLVVTCPCALSLATPAALTAATGALTRSGVLTTRGHALETLARATHLLLDKTGTLTRGELRLTAVHPVRELDRRRCLALAAAL
ncbi:MAG: heavy metal translocating P-type ATPase, partial [Chromatiales bacterium]